MKKLFRAATLSATIVAAAAMAQGPDTTPPPQQDGGTQQDGQHGHQGQSQQTGHSSQRHQGGQVTRIQRGTGTPERTAPARNVDAGQKDDDADCAALAGKALQDCMERDSGDDERPADRRDGGRA